MCCFLVPGLYLSVLFRTIIIICSWRVMLRRLAACMTCMVPLSGFGPERVQKSVPLMSEDTFFVLDPNVGSWGMQSYLLEHRGGAFLFTYLRFARLVRSQRERRRGAKPGRGGPLWRPQLQAAGGYRFSRCRRCRPMFGGVPRESRTVFMLLLLLKSVFPTSSLPHWGLVQYYTMVKGV